MTEPEQTRMPEWVTPEFEKSARRVFGTRLGRTLTTHELVEYLDPKGMLEFIPV